MTNENSGTEFSPEIMGQVLKALREGLGATHLDIVRELINTSNKISSATIQRAEKGESVMHIMYARICHGLQLYAHDRGQEFKYATFRDVYADREAILTQNIQPRQWRRITKPDGRAIIAVTAQSQVPGNQEPSAAINLSSLAIVFQRLEREEGSAATLPDLCRKLQVEPQDYRLLMAGRLEDYDKQQKMLEAFCAHYGVSSMEGLAKVARKKCHGDHSLMAMLNRPATRAER